MGFRRHAQGANSQVHRALVRAEEAIEADLTKHRPAWRHAIPDAFQDRGWDFFKFSRGERFVGEPLPEGKFSDVFEQVDRWDLAQHMGERNPEYLVY